MKDEKKDEVVDTSKKEVSTEAEGAAKKTPTDTAPKEDKPVKDETQKPPEDAKAKEPTDKPVEDTAETGNEVEPDELLEKVNEILGELYEGKSIESIQDEIRPLMSDLLNASVALKALSESNIWGPVLNDLMDQAEDGQTPNPDLAFVRAAPKDYVDRLYEGSDDEAVLKASEDYKAGVKANEESEATVNSNLDQSLKDAEEFSSERGYNDEEKAAFMEQVKMWFKVFADGRITKDEYSLIEKGMNYDKDMSDLQSQIPEEPKKEVMPDKSSIDASKVEKPQAKKPMGMESIAYSGTDVTDVGRRKRRAGA